MSTTNSIVPENLVSENDLFRPETHFSCRCRQSKSYHLEQGITAENMQKSATIYGDTKGSRSATAIPVMLAEDETAIIG